MRCLPLPRTPAPLLLHRLRVTLRNGKLRHKRPASQCAPCSVSDLPPDFELNLLGLKADPRFSPLQLHQHRPPTRIRRPHLSTNLQRRRRQLTRHRRTRPHTCRIPTNRPGAAPWAALAALRGIPQVVSRRNKHNTWESRSHIL